MTAITAAAAVLTLGCLAALVAAVVMFLRTPGVSRAYTEQEVQRHASTMIGQIEQYLSRRGA